ncbi:hypothetical protein DACRYDRAFT_24636, partial [Dacryopinax primogenitus]
NILQIHGPSPFFVFFDFARCYPYSIDTVKGTSDRPGLWQCLVEIESSENVVAWVEPQFVRGEPWAVNVFTEEVFEQFKESIPDTEDPYLLYVQYLKQEREKPKRSKVREHLSTPRSPISTDRDEIAQWATNFGVPRVE